MTDIVEVMARGINASSKRNDRHECSRPELPMAMSKQVAQAALTALHDAGYAVVLRIPSPKICEAGLFANDYALLIRADAGDMFEAYTAMIQAAEQEARDGRDGRG